MPSCHAATAVDGAFDDPNLIADAGLVRDPEPVDAITENSLGGSGLKWPRREMAPWHGRGAGHRPRKRQSVQLR